MRQKQQKTRHDLTRIQLNLQLNQTWQNLEIFFEGLAVILIFSAKNKIKRSFSDCILKPQTS